MTDEAPPLDPAGVALLERLADEAAIARLRVALKGPGVGFKDRLFYGRQIARTEAALRLIHETRSDIIERGRRNG